MRNVLQDYLDEHSFRVVVKKKNYLTYEGLQDRYAYILKVASSKLALFPKTVVNLIYVISTILKLFHCYVMNIQNLLMHLLIFASNLHKQNFTKSTVFNFGGISIIVKTCKCMSKNTIGTV